MRIEIEIPKEFEEHFNQDQFEDSLLRLREDAHLLAGNYERETAEMLVKAFKDSKPVIDKTDLRKGLNNAMKKFYIYEDVKTNEYRTLDEIRQEYYVANDSDIDIAYKDFEHIILTSMLVSNGGKYRVLSEDNSPEYKLALAINNVLNEVNSNGTGRYFNDLEHQENVATLMSAIKSKDKSMCAEYEKCLLDYGEDALARKLHNTIFDNKIKSKNRSIR